MKVFFHHWILIPAVLLVVLPQVYAQSITGEKLSLAEGLCVTKTQSLISEGRLAKAIETLETYIHGVTSKEKKGRVHPYLYFLLGNTYLSQESGDPGSDSRKASECYKSVLKTAPDFTAAWLNLARCCYDLSDYSQASQAFEKGYGCSQVKKPVHLYYAAVCSFQAQDSKRALSLFETLMKQHPQAVTLARKEVLVNILFSMEKYVKALPFVEELAEKTPAPKQKKWQEILLQQYLNLEMDKQALDYAQKLTRIDPLEPKWWKGLSHIHLKNNRPENGLTAMVIYGFLTPMTPEEIELTADLYLSMDIPKKAALLYRDRFEKAPDQGTLEKMIQAFAMAHEPDDALKWIEKGLNTPEKLKNKTDLLLLKAQLLYLQKSWEEAAQAYEKAALKNEDSKKAGELWLMLGYSAMNCKRFKQAEKAFDKASKYKKQRKYALGAITQIKMMKTLQPMENGS